MKYFEFSFNCPDGQYTLSVKNEEQVFSYIVSSTIEGFTEKSGILTEKDTNEFIEKLNKANILSWDKYYGNKKLDDACTWNIVIDDFSTSGEESFEPYNYQYLIEALQLIEDNVDYFIV